MRRFLNAAGMIVLVISVFAWNFGEGLFVWGSRAYQYLTYKEPSTLTLVSVDTFIGMCLNAQYRADDHVAFAETMGWQPLDDAIVAMMRPPAPQEFYKGWVAYPPDFPTFSFFAFAGRSADSETPQVETCGAFFRSIQGTEFTDEFVRQTRASLAYSDQTFAGLQRGYTIPDLPNVIVSIGLPGLEETDVMAYAIYPIAN